MKFTMMTFKNNFRSFYFRDVGSLFEQEDRYYKPIRVGNFWNNNCIDYESNGHRNKDLSLKEYVKETKPYLKDILTDLQKSGP